MKKYMSHWIIGTFFLTLGLLIAIGPQTIFKPCSALLEITAEEGARGMTVPMRCHWSAKAEIGIGGVIALLGLLLLFFHNVQVRLGLSMALPALGLVSVLLPGRHLIGVCMARTMECRILMLPMLTMLGSLIIAVSLVYTVVLVRKARKRPA